MQGVKMEFKKGIRTLNKNQAQILEIKNVGSQIKASWKAFPTEWIKGKGRR